MFSEPACLFARLKKHMLEKVYYYAYGIHAWLVVHLKGNSNQSKQTLSDLTVQVSAEPVQISSSEQTIGYLEDSEINI